LSPDEFDNLCSVKIDNLKYTEEQISYIEEATRNQSSSSSWFEQRLGRITGSIFYDACHTSLEKPSKTLIKRSVKFPLKN